MVDRLSWTSKGSSEASDDGNDLKLVLTLTFKHIFEQFALSKQNKPTLTHQKLI